MVKITMLLQSFPSYDDSRRSALRRQTGCSSALLALSAPRLLARLPARAHLVVAPDCIVVAPLDALVAPVAARLLTPGCLRALSRFARPPVGRRV
eukprot:1968498-Prymnesium_polylepis.1